jgi:hypothetical protein
VNVAAADPFTLSFAFSSLSDGRGSNVDLRNDGLDLPGYSIDAAGRIVRIR